MTFASTTPVVAMGAGASSGSPASSSPHDFSAIPRASSSSSSTNTGSNYNRIKNIPTTASDIACATLTLTPLHRKECQKILQEMKKLPPSSPSDNPSDEDYLDMPRRRIRLKLCTEEVHILDSDIDENNHYDGFDALNNNEDNCGSNGYDNINHNNNNATSTTNKNHINHGLVTKYARTYRDGSTASVIVLGRNSDTCIKWSRISRALCDVSLGSIRRRRERDDRRRSNHQNEDGIGIGNVSGRDFSELAADEDADVIFDDDADDEKYEYPCENICRSNLNSTTQHEKYIPTAWLCMRKSPNQHGVFLNGELVRDAIGKQRKLEHGAILSLYGPTGFAYQVDISFGESKCVAAESVATALAGAGEITMESKKRKATIANDNQTSKLVKAEIEETGQVTEEEKGPTNNIRQVQNDANTEQPQAASAAKTVVEALHHKSRQHGQQLLLGECTCAMCMDILVQSTFASPCAHAFCRKCAEELDPELKEESAASAASSSGGASSAYAESKAKKKNTKKVKPECPTCRGEVEGWIPARSFDTVVWSVALQGCFGRDDAEVYLKRREECGDPVASQEHKDSVLNVGVDVAGADGIDVGNDVDARTLSSSSIAYAGASSVAVGSGIILQPAVGHGTHFPVFQPLQASSARLVSSAEASIESLQNYASRSHHFGGGGFSNPESQVFMTGSSAEDAICLD
ncbi:hypothetical protein ACHAXS_007420 [Conticribra weissflogii]